MIVTVLFGVGLGVSVPILASRFIRYYRMHQGIRPKFTCDNVWCLLIGGGGFVGLAFVLHSLRFTSQDAIFSLLLISMMAVIALVDFSVHRIPNKMVVGLFVWAIVRTLVFGYPSFSQVFLGALVAGGMFTLIALAGRGAMGTGDVKLATAIGAVLGYPTGLVALVIGIIAGGVAAFLLILTRRIGRKDYMAYGPYLVLGALVMLIL